MDADSAYVCREETTGVRHLQRRTLGYLKVMLSLFPAKPLRSLSNNTVILDSDRAFQQRWSFDVAFVIGASNERAIGMSMKKTMILILLSWSSATNQTAGRDSAIGTYSGGI